jgi:hypothetical protein
MTLRLTPGTAQYEHYDELQRTLCAALNWRCHWDAARLAAECDPLLWYTTLPVLVEDVTAEMAAMGTKEMTDGLSLPEHGN